MSHIRLVWDFHGPDAEQTAKHHAIHLKEFAIKESLTMDNAGIEHITDQHVYAYLDVTTAEMKIARDALMPHRGLKIES